MVDNDTDGDGVLSAPVYTGKNTPTAVHFSTGHHDYEATYSYEEDFGAEGSGGSAFGGMHCFTVTNRRLGKINLTVLKNWVDGDGELRKALAEELEAAGLSLAVRLEFLSEASLGTEDIYEITRNGYGKEEGDTVTISEGNEVRIQMCIRDRA